MASWPLLRPGDTQRLVYLYGPPAAALLAAVLPLGGIMPGWAVFAALVAGLTLALQRHEGDDRLPVVALPFFALGALTLLQVVPLPHGVLAKLSPHAADVWSTARGPLGTPEGLRTLSLAPELTAVEAAKWMSYGAMAWVGETLCRKRSVSPVARLVLALSITVGVVTLVHGAFEISQVYGVYKPKADFPRWHIGPLLNVNHLSGYLSLGVYAALALALADRKEQPLRTVGFLFAGIALVTGVVLLASRGAVGALVVGTVLATAVAYRVGRDRTTGATLFQRLAFPAAVLVCGLGLAFLGYEGAIASGLGEKNFAKLVVAKDALAMIRDNLWTGVGRGAFGGAYHAYKQQFPDAFWTHPENIAVQWLTEWGVPVSVAALFAFVFAFRKSRVGRSVGAAVLATGLLALLAQNLVDYGLELPGVAALAALVVGAVTGERTLRAPAWGRKAAAAVLAAVCFLAIARRPVSNEEARREAHAHAAKVDDVAPYLLRFPADPYFSFLAGTLVAREGGDPSRALAWYNHALVLSPNELDAHLYAGDVLARSGRRSQALLQFREAAARCPGWESYVAPRVVALARTEEELLSTVPYGAPNEAAYFRALAAIVPETSRAYDAILAKRLESAPCDLQVLKRRVAGRTVRLERSECQGEARPACLARAHEDVDKLVQCGAPQDAELAGIELAWFEGRKDESVARLDKACEKGWGDEKACTELLASRAAVAKELALLGRIERQLASRECVTSDRCGEVWKKIAGWHLLAGDAGGALSAARKAVEVSPSDLDAQRLLARTAESAGASVVAYRAYQAILARKPGDPDAKAAADRLAPKAVPDAPPKR